MARDNEAVRIINGNPRLRASLQASLDRLSREPALQKLGVRWDEAIRTSSLEGLEGAVGLSPAFERVIKVLGRPALLVVNGRYEVPLLDYWYKRLEPSRASIERALTAVGRVEVMGNADAGPVGTAWIVAPGIAVTNRHVAVAFARGSGAQFVFKADFMGNDPLVMSDFKQEYKTPGSRRIDVESVLHIEPEPGPDVAILKLRPPVNGAEPQPIALDGSSSLARKNELVALGYPMSDPEEDPAVLSSVFGNVFWKKRVSPGEVTEVEPGEIYFSHDCSTLGGNSGSALFDFERDAAVGLHFRGYARKANHAVHAGEILRILKQLGVGVPSVVPARVAQGCTPGPAAATARVAAEGYEPEERPRRSAADYDDREGYVANFLGRGFEVAVPIVKDRSDLVRLIGGGETELKYTHFSLEMSVSRRMPVWTAVNIHGKLRRNPPRESRWSFDPRIEQYAQVGDEYYRSSKADRGHIVRRLDPTWGEESFEAANVDTFHFTNACPQVHRFNDGIWGDLEDYALAEARQGKISVFTGPFFDDGDFEEFDVKVPTQFWKVIVRKDAEHRLSASAFRLSQESYLGELEGPRTAKFWLTYQMPIKRLELSTGLSFGDLARADAFTREESVPREGPLASIDEARF